MIGSNSRLTLWILAAIVVVGAVLRFKAIDFGLPHTQARPDETVIIDAARDLLSGRLPRFYDYPWLYIWFATLAYLGYFVWGVAVGSFQTLGGMVASWPVHWEPFFLIPRILSATLGTVTILVAYRLGRQLRDDVTGLVAAALLAVTYMHVRNSHFGTTDVTMVLLILLAVSFILDAHRSGRQRDYVRAAIVSGLAAATKYNAALLAAPVAVCYLLALATPGTRRHAHRNIVTFGLVFVLVLLVGVPFVLLDHERFQAAMGELSRALSTGDPRLDLTNGWLHHLQYSLRYGVGLPLLVAGTAGMAALTISQPRAAAIVLSFPVAYYAVAGSFSLLFFRYVIPVVPFLCVTAAWLIVATVSRFMPAASAPAVAVTAALTAAVGAPTAWSAWEFDRIMSQTDNRVLVSEWFAKHVPPGSSLLQSGGRYGHAQFDRHLKYKVWQWDGTRMAFMFEGRRATGLPDLIVVQESPLPSTTQDEVKAMLTQGYSRVADFHAVTLSDRLVYDRLDQFYVPFSGFADVRRPGPNFSVYKRAEVALH